MIPQKIALYFIFKQDISTLLKPKQNKKEGSVLTLKSPGFLVNV